MPQEDYDQGYEDGKVSRQSEIDGLMQQYALARSDLERARAESQRLSDIVHRPRLVATTSGHATTRPDD